MRAASGGRRLAAAASPRGRSGRGSGARSSAGAVPTPAGRASRHASAVMITGSLGGDGSHQPRLHAAHHRPLRERRARRARMERDRGEAGAAGATCELADEQQAGQLRVGVGLEHAVPGVAPAGRARSGAAPRWTATLQVKTTSARSSTRRSCSSRSSRKCPRWFVWNVVSMPSRVIRVPREHRTGVERQHVDAAGPREQVRRGAAHVARSARSRRSGSAPTASATARVRTASRPIGTTSWPLRGERRAAASPMPELAPVSRIVRGVIPRSARDASETAPEARIRSEQGVTFRSSATSRAA